MRRSHHSRNRFLHGIAGAAALACAALPLAAPAACTGKYAAMQSWAGSYLHEKNLLAAPPVAARLQQLPATVRNHLKRNLFVAGTIDLVGCGLVLTGIAAHMGGEEGAIVDLNLYSGAVTIGIHSRGRIDIWLDKAPATATQRSLYDEVPGAVRNWAVLADMGFPYQQPRSVRVHAPR
ncbi:MAG TPA: hypothetical protein VFW88_00210 [Burkholderiales bacterium]|jgi:hypothetical protein|nr:hypothetical protein [Burkholderiales bacterium]